MNEAETRAEHIDPALKAAGWGEVEGSRVLREHPITLGRLQGGGGKRTQALMADYVLVYRNTKLAVIEAKAWDKPHTEGTAQALTYAQRLGVRYAYATNGQQIYRIDRTTGAEGDVAAYPSPQALWQATFAEVNAWRDRFAAVPYPDKGGSWQLRYYQEGAVSQVLDRISHGHKRILLTLATGTGKTSIAFQIVWKLFSARWSLTGEPTRQPRVLFLADRNTLADQAYKDFNAFMAFEERALIRIEPDEIRKNAGRVPKNGSVFFTIFQTFMSGPPKEGQPSPYFGAYPQDFFDAIVIDECHRGGARDESEWRAILAYFEPAVQIGLTATPKRTINADTYAYFGDPVYTYSLKDGINDGFLTPFKVKQIATTLDDYVYTPDDLVVEGQIETGKRYEEKDFNKSIEIRAREAYRVKLFMGMIDPREKTLVFCATQDHALTVRDLINQAKTHSKDPNYCVRVTANDGAIGDQHLRDFQDNEKTIPTILTTSQKLTTGVDARNVRNIVLMRPVNSMIEFKQIIGRGTRLYDGKDYFTLYDFVKAHHHFSDPEWDGDPAEPVESVGDAFPGSFKPPAEAFDDRPSDKTSDPGTPNPEPKPPRIKVKLADGKERKLQFMSATSFWSPDGKPISAAQFMEGLFGVMPEFFRDEDELRRIWSDPETRIRLLAGLAERGFDGSTLKGMQTCIEAENSDLFDVLAYVGYATDPMARTDRAQAARAAMADQFSNDKQRAFIDFVLSHYVSEGVEELAPEKLTPLLKLRYRNAVRDAISELGPPETIRALFIGMQRHLYER